MRRQKVRRGLILVSLLLFPVTLNYLSPAVIVFGASQGIVSGSFILFAMLFASSLVLGRGFCGWICPAAGLQEACSSVRDRPVRGGRRDWIKYFIWAPWLATIAAFAVAAGGLRSVDPFLNTDHGVSVSEPALFIVYYAVVALIAVPALVGGKRAFCHYLCWMAPFMIVGRAIRNRANWPALHLRAAPLAAPGAAAALAPAQ